MRLKLAGADRSSGIGVFVPWRARTIVQQHGARRAGRPQLKRDPLDCRNMASVHGLPYLSLMTLSLNLPSDTERRLADIAKRLNVPVTDLAAAAVRDLLAQPAEDFEAVARRVLDKNRELYRRLA